MVRTQIYLPKSLLKELKETAAKEGITLSELIRRMLTRNIETIEEPGQSYTHTQMKSFLEQILEVSEKYNNKSAPDDLAMNHDKYLYDNKE